MDSNVYQKYFSLEDTHWWFIGRRKILQDILSRVIPSKVERACDIGCGKGENLALLSAVAEKLSGVEMRVEAVELAKQRFRDAKILSGVFPDVYTEDSCDVVTMFDVLEHIEDDVAALRRIYESLSPDGFLVCTVPAFPFLWSAHDDIVHHKRRYTKKTLRAALEDAGFSIERITYFNALFFIPTVVFRLLKRNLTRSQSSDLFSFPPVLNRALAALFGGERFPLRFLNIPFGVSLLAIARRRG